MSEGPPTDFATRRIVLEVEARSPVAVTRGSVARGDRSEIPLTVYHAPGDRAPAVLLVTGYPDPGFRRFVGVPQQAMGAYVSWSELLASRGLTAVTYENIEPVPDTRAVFDALCTRASELGIDSGRLGVWSCSGNVANALGLLASRPHVRCATLLYGYTMDVEGGTAVAAAAATHRFANPLDGRPIDALPSDVRLLLVRATRDANPGLNESLARFAAAARARGMPITLRDYDGPHAFDLEDDGAAARAEIEAVIAFLRAHLGAA